MSRLYNERDALLEHAEDRLDRTARSSTVGTPGARAERDAFMRLYGERVRTLQNVEQRLCFGRLDLADGQRRYIGRIGISDEARRELLVDWRAPAAEPFYQATAARPGGVLRRRQIATDGRRVTGVQDEVLDLAGFEAAGVDGGHVGRRRGGAVRQPRRRAQQPDARHRRDDPGRPGRRDPGAAARRARRARRARHRQDGGSAAPHGVPALRQPRADRPLRRAAGRPEPGVPALHRPGAARAR